MAKEIPVEVDFIELIKEQGEIVRKLKADKADSSVIKQEVEKLIDLKTKAGQTNSGGDAPKSSLVVKSAKGCRDYGPKEMAIREKVLNMVIGVFKLHGAETIDTPVFELSEILKGKYGEEGGKLIYDLQDQGGEQLSLRYDLTVPFARYLALNNIINMKRYSIAKVYRRDEPRMTRGRYREFYQCDYDIAGQYEPLVPESECMRVVYEVLNTLQLGEFEIKLNHRRLLDGMFAVCGVPESQFKTICSSVDKLDKTFWEDVRQEIVNEKHLHPVVAEKLEVYVRIREQNASLSCEELVDKLMADSELMQNKHAKTGLEQIQKLLKYCHVLGIKDRVAFDPSLARGLDYYTGSIFEAVVKGYAHAAEATNGTEGQTNHDCMTGVGSVAGGGRYDGLVGTFNAKKRSVPCVGVSFGIERIFSIMEMKAKSENTKVRTTETQVYVCSAQKGLLMQRLTLVKELWDAGIKAEVPYNANPKMLTQLQFCEERGIPLAVIIGETELENNQVKMRIVDSREETMVDRFKMIESIKEKLHELQCS